MLRSVSFFALASGLLMQVAVPAHAQRGGGTFAGDWERLGCVDARRRGDRQSIRIGRDDGRFTAIRFVSTRNDVLVDNIRVVFGNGDRQRVRVRERIREDTTTRAIDLDGRRRFLRSIELTVERADSSERRGPGQLCVFGLASFDGRNDRGGIGRGGDFGRDDDGVRGRDRGERGGRDGGDERDRRRGDDRRVDDDRRGGGRALAWTELGCANTGLRDDFDIIPVGRQDGRFKAIRLRAVGGKIEVDRLRVIYGNGSPDRIDAATSLNRGEATRPIDLQGGDRFIRQVELVTKQDTRDAVRGIVRGLVSGRGPRGAEVCVDGLEDERFERRRR